MLRASMEPTSSWLARGVLATSNSTSAAEAAPSADRGFLRKNRITKSSKRQVKPSGKMNWGKILERTRDITSHPHYIGRPVDIHIDSRVVESFELGYVPYSSHYRFATTQGTLGHLSVRSLVNVLISSPTMRSGHGA